ncbi:MAG: DUF2141 domain-containing protein [Sphingomonas bacterium]
MKRALLLLPLLTGAAPAPGVLTIEVGNVRVAKGVVHVDICPEAKFLKDDCPYSGEAPARLGTTRVVVSGLPAGDYAAQAFLDENHNGKVDRALFGIPKEGVGFSNDAKIGLGPPKFSEARFHFDGAGKAIRLNLRYFLGAKGPPAKS